MRIWDEVCGPPIMLRVIKGPKAGLCHVYCTCGWERDFMSKKSAQRAIERHEAAQR